MTPAPWWPHPVVVRHRGPTARTGGEEAVTVGRRHRGVVVDRCADAAVRLHHLVDASGDRSGVGAVEDGQVRTMMRPKPSQPTCVESTACVAHTVKFLLSKGPDPTARVIRTVSGGIAESQIVGCELGWWQSVDSAQCDHEHRQFEAGVVGLGEGEQLIAGVAVGSEYCVGVDVVAGSQRRRRVPDRSEGGRDGWVRSSRCRVRPGSCHLISDLRPLSSSDHGGVARS